MENTENTVETPPETTSEFRKLATIQKILSLTPIEGADKIECAKVLGWNVVVRKGEFSVGDYGVYFEIDSLLPAKEWNVFLHNRKDQTAPIRLKTIRLRGQLSQGLLMPLSTFPELTAPTTGEFEGLDVTEQLGVKKWEPVTSFNAADRPKSNFPSYIKKTDSLRVQAYPAIIQELHGKEVYGTIKVDGTSTTFYNYCNQFGVCSRNLDLLDTESSKYWAMARKYNLLEGMAKLCEANKMNLAVQAETYGMGIQKNKLGIPDVQIAVFDVFDIDKGRYMDYKDLKYICQILNVPMVETVLLGTFMFESVAEMVEYANGLLYPNGTPAEGVVIRPTVEMYSEVLRGRCAIKAISNTFLEKYGE